MSLFPNSRITEVSTYGPGAPKPAGSVLVVNFELFGQPWAALNGGPNYTHSPAVSFQVHGDTQDEIDRLWSSLVADGGAEGRCGWCTDRFGISWQIIPTRLGELLSHTDPQVSGAAMGAMMQMTKIDIAALEAAAGLR